MPAQSRGWVSILTGCAALLDGTAIATVRLLRRITYPLGVLGSALLLALQPRVWTRPVRNVLARQVLFTGVEALFFSARVSVAVGILIVVQAQLWLSQIGESEWMGNLLLNVLVREIGPLLANFVVVVRSGTAIATELAHMRLEGEVDVLDAQGLDPMIYLVMPRVIATAISVFCLAVVIVTVTFLSGYVVAELLGAVRGGPAVFFAGILSEVGVEELYFFLPKTLISGLLIGAICSVEGLSIRGAVTEIPQIAGRGAVRSLTIVFGVSAVLSLIIYGSVLFIDVF